MDPTLRQPYTLPDRFTWANSAHTDFREAHIIVLDLKPMGSGSAATPARTWLGSVHRHTDMYRQFIRKASWRNLEREAEAVHWIAGWVRKYEREIGGGGRHPAVAPRYVLERMKDGR